MALRHREAVLLAEHAQQPAEHPAARRIGRDVAVHGVAGQQEPSALSGEPLLPEPAARIVTGIARAEGGAPLATVVGTSLRTGAVWAALANGTAAHALDYDDVALRGHPSTVLVPAIRPPTVPAELKPGVTAKDIILALLAKIGVGGGTGSISWRSACR